MTNTLINQILQLSISERLELIENIWDSIVDMPDEIELTEEQKQELDYRLELYEQNSAKGSSWEEVKPRIKNIK